MAAPALLPGLAVRDLGAAVLPPTPNNGPLLCLCLVLAACCWSTSGALAPTF